MSGVSRRTFLQVACLTALIGTVDQPNALAETLTELVARAKPSVVLVGTYAATDSPRFGFRGTGFVVGNGNLVVTNMHVLPDVEALAGAASREIAVQVRSGVGTWSRRVASIVARDQSHDLVVLKFEGPSAQPLSLAPKERATEGAEVAIMGFPLGGALGFSTVTHHGILAAITGISLPPPKASSLNARAVRQIRAGTFDIYQLDATAYPGNSGGPVFDVRSGEVLGILNMVLVKGSKETALSQPSGISYAIPAYFAAELLSGL